MVAFLAPLLAGAGAKAAAISAGASLLGGALNRGAQNKANKANRPVNQVREWEEAGINPLFGLTSGSYIPHQANTAMGDSVATAGGLFAEHLSRGKEQELRETQLDLENQLLKKELDKLAKPVEPGHMERHGGALPLPFTRNNPGETPSGSRSQNPESVPKALSFGDRFLGGDGADSPYLSGHLFGSTGDPVGSHRVEAPEPSSTLQPLSFLGMKIRGTGTTTAAHMVEDNAGDLAGSAWAVPVIADYAVGTYLENVGRPFGDWMMGVVEDVSKPAKKPKANAGSKSRKRNRN